MKVDIVVLVDSVSESVFLGESVVLEDPLAGPQVITHVEIDVLAEGEKKDQEETGEEWIKPGRLIRHSSPQRVQSKTKKRNEGYLATEGHGLTRMFSQKNHLSSSVVQIFLILGLGGGDDGFEILEDRQLDRSGFIGSDVGLGGRKIPQLIFDRALHVRVLGDLVFRFGKFRELVGAGFFGLGESVHGPILTP